MVLPSPSRAKHVYAQPGKWIRSPASRPKRVARSAPLTYINPSLRVPRCLGLHAVVEVRNELEPHGVASSLLFHEFVHNRSAYTSEAKATVVEKVLHRNFPSKVGEHHDCVIGAFFCSSIP